MREDSGEVTASLDRPVTDSSRSRPLPYDSFEWPPEQQPPSEGVPRSAWTRHNKRLSRWHRPYTMALILLDLISVTLASYVAAVSLERSRSGFGDWGFLEGRELFRLFAYVVLPLGGLYQPIWKYDVKTLAEDLGGHRDRVDDRALAPVASAR